jgi:LPXTG-motif cell wall-anchored protein
VWAPLSRLPAVADALPAVAVGQTAFLPVTGLGTTVPMSLAAGLLLSGAATVATTGRRRRRLVRS